MPAFVVLTLSAHGGQDDRQVRVTVGAPTEPDVIAWLLGRRKGFFEEHGGKAGDIVAGQGGATERVGAGGLGEGVALLEGGDVDLAGATSSAIAKDPSKFKLIASAADHLPEFQATVLSARMDYVKNNPRAIEGILAGLNEAQQRSSGIPTRPARSMPPRSVSGPGRAG
ncbi:hypothetical protein [Streptosporangium sp. NPDC001681]|uniref:hypothetical protein n=1 Tax=Streptosporangium sp. NPDC001681 TaxID=3154395 RepID=UPI003325BA74